MPITRPVLLHARGFVRLFIALLLGATPADSQTAVQLFQRAAEALGGEARLRALGNTSIEFTSINYSEGQQAGTHAPPRGTFFTGRIVNDFTRGRRLVIQESRQSPTFLLTFRQLVDGDVGFSQQQGASGPAAPEQLRTLQRGLRVEPVRLVLAGLDAPASLTALPSRQLRGLTVHAVRFAGRDTITMLFDPLTALPVAVELLTDDAILGDRLAQTTYSNWREAGGVLLPRQIDVTWNGSPTQHVLVTAATTNALLADSLFAVPDSIRSRGPVAPAAPVVTLVELAPRVWRAEGGGHHSLVVEQGDQLVVVEAPDAARTRALLDTLRSRFPGKRVGRLVVSHHHWDHTGGVRTAMAAGIPVAVHERNAPFVQRIARAPKTLVPDAIATGRQRAPAISEVRDSLVIGRGDERVVLHSLPNTHSEGMLVVYLPASKLLFEVDVISPGAGAPARGPSAEVVALVRRRGLAVDRVVGGHGGIAEFAALERAAAP